MKLGCDNSCCPGQGALGADPAAGAEPPPELPWLVVSSVIDAPLYLALIFISWRWIIPKVTLTLKGLLTEYFIFLLYHWLC